MRSGRQDYCPTAGEPCQSGCTTPCGSNARQVEELAMLVRKLVQQRDLASYLEYIVFGVYLGLSS